MFLCRVDPQGGRGVQEGVLVREGLGPDALQQAVRAVHAVHYASVPCSYHDFRLCQHLSGVVDNDHQEIRHEEWLVSILSVGDQPFSNRLVGWGVRLFGTTCLGHITDIFFSSRSSHPTVLYEFLKDVQY